MKRDLCTADGLMRLMLMMSKVNELLTIANDANRAHEDVAKIN